MIKLFLDKAKEAKGVEGGAKFDHLVNGASTLGVNMEDVENQRVKDTKGDNALVYSLQNFDAAIVRQLLDQDSDYTCVDFQHVRIYSSHSVSNIFSPLIH